MPLQEIRVPDIGDFADIPVIEILVRVGESIDEEQGLLTVESDKATLEVPTPRAGVVKELCVRIGDRISRGTLIARLETTEPLRNAPEAPLRQPLASPPPAPSASAASRTTSPLSGDELVVIGGGPGGYSAAFRAADLGLRVTLIEREPVLGGVCLNVGCIPSKALLHLTDVMHEASTLAARGISFGPPRIDLEAMRTFKAGVIERLTRGLSRMARSREVKVIQGTASFRSPHELTVTDQSGGESIHSFRQCIVAAGSSPAALPFLPIDARIVDSTGALELRQIPRSMLIIGGGIIGLEMATLYGELGARVDIVEATEALLPGVDRDLVNVWRKRNERWLNRVMTSTQIVDVACHDSHLEARFDTHTNATSYDLILRRSDAGPMAER